MSYGDGPDVVYVVRAGDRNEELRYSLRSLRNLPHGRVWMAGHKPSWVADDVGHIPAPSQPGHHKQTKANLRAACEHPDVSERFYYFNDDMFVMRPVDLYPPVVHRGRLTAAINSRGMAVTYTRAMKRTAAILAEHGIDDPLMYDLHVPMLVEKDVMLYVLDMTTHPDDLERTLYGNLQEVRGSYLGNVKVRLRERGWEQWPYISTNDSSFARHKVGEYIRARFPDMGPYESTPPVALTRGGGVVTRPPRPRARPVRYTAGRVSRVGRISAAR